MPKLPLISDRTDLTIVGAVKERGRLNGILKSGNWPTAFENKIRRRLTFIEDFIVQTVCNTYGRATPDDGNNYCRESPDNEVNVDTNPEEQE